VRYSRGSDLKAIVHIGTEKTGTTSIQTFLYLNRKKLRKAGYHFLQSAGKLNHQALPAYCLEEERYDDFFFRMGLVSADKRREFKRQFIESFEKELAALPSAVHTVLISSEHFHSRIRSDEEMDNVQRLLTQYFDEIRIICYLREQVATCTSYYSTTLKGGSVKTLAQHMRSCSPKAHYFNYLKLLDNWEKRFGFEALDIALFDPRAFVNGNLLDDFAARIDPALVGVLDRDIPKENESVSAEGQALLLALNRALPKMEVGGELEKVRQQCVKLVCERFGGPGQQLPGDAQRGLFESFLESNEQVREKFFPRRKALFKAPPIRPQRELALDEPFVRTLIDILALIKERMGNGLDSRDYANASAQLVASLSASILNDEEDAAKGKTLSLHDEDADLFRRAALQVEHRDLEAAIGLMQIARQVKPSLSGIHDRLGEYQRRLEAREVTEQFLFAYYFDREVADPEEQQRIVAGLGEWAQSLKCAEGSNLVFLADGQRVGGALTGYMCVGYTIVRAASADAASALAETCPVLSAVFYIDVSRIVPLVPEAYSRVLRR